MLRKVRQKTETLNKELNEHLDTVIHDFACQGESLYNEYERKIKQLEEIFAQQRQLIKNEIRNLEDHKELNNEVLLEKYRKLNQINENFDEKLEELIKKHQEETQKLAKTRRDELNKINNKTNNEIDELLEETDEFLVKAEDEARNDFSRAMKLNHSAAEKFKTYLDRRVRCFVDEYQNILKNYRNEQ